MYTRATILAVGLLFVPALARGADYSARYDSPSIPVLRPGKTVTVEVTVTNTGTKRWSGAASELRLVTSPYLTYHLESPNDPPEYDIQPTFLPRAVEPGESIMVPVEVTGPTGNGPYTLRWDMVRAGSWFSSRGIHSKAVALKSASKIAALAAIVVDIQDRPFGPWDQIIGPLLFTGPDVVRPGGMYYPWDGLELGTTPGKAALLGSFPGGRLDLQIVSWTDTAIGVKVPYICGVLDQEVQLEVTTAANRTATSPPLRFEATRETRHLTQPEMQVECSDAAGRNRCNNVGTGPALLWIADLAQYPWWAATGQHQCGLSSAAGLDKFSISLKNGWAPSGANAPCELDQDPIAPCFKVEFSPPQSANFRGPGEWIAGDPALFEVPWGCHLLGQYVEYWYDVMISGPCGTPHL